MKEKKNSKFNQDNFLESEFIDETQVRIPDGYELVKKYSLKPPFSYANILYNKERSSYLYFVDELKLNREELAIFQSLYKLIEESLESPAESKSATFDGQLDSVLKENEKLFLNNSNASMEKVNAKNFPSQVS